MLGLRSIRHHPSISSESRHGTDTQLEGLIPAPVSVGVKAVPGQRNCGGQEGSHLLTGLGVSDEATWRRRPHVVVCCVSAWEGGGCLEAFSMERKQYGWVWVAASQQHQCLL